MVKWRTGFYRIPLTLVTLSAYTANFILVSGIETSALPSTIASPTVATSVAPGNKRVPKQVGAPGGVVTDGKDHQQAETGYGHGHDHGHGFTHGHGLGHGGHGHGLHGDGKYFQYAHNPAYDEYEYGYRRGNDYHFQERYEKYGPAWNFKTKVKWGDKYGGYGEHYWDYNHAGSSHGDGGHGDGHYSEPVPSYEAQSSDNKKQSMIAKRENSEKLGRLQDGNKGESGDEDLKRVVPLNKVQDSQPAQSSERSQRREREYRRQAQVARPRGETGQMQPSLVLDPQTGQVIDETTGRAYWLKPARK